MKEAAGEANMTVITIVLIGVVAAVGLVLVPRLMSGVQHKACCTDAGGKWSNNACQVVSGISFDRTGYTSCTAAK